MNKRILIFLIFLLGLSSLISCTKSSAWTQYDEDNYSVPISSNDMIIDQSNNLWIASYGEFVYRYDATLQQWEAAFSVQDNGLNSVVNVLTSGPDNALWVGAKTGLGRYQHDTKSWTIYTRQNGLDNEDIRAILFDHEGNVWVGTGGGGIFLSQDLGNSWQHIIIEEEFSEFTVHAIYQDSRNHIWIAGNALYHFDPASQIWSTFTDGADRANSLTGEWETPPSETAILPDDFVFSFLEDENGILWFGTLTAGVLWYDLELKQWGQFTSADGLIDDTVKAIDIDTSGNIWFGTDDGASRYNHELNEWTSFNREKGFTNYSTSSIVMDEQGRLWFATFGDGVYMFDPHQ